MVISQLAYPGVNAAALRVGRLTRDIDKVCVARDNSHNLGRASGVPTILLGTYYNVLSPLLGYLGT